VFRHFRGSIVVAFSISSRVSSRFAEWHKRRRWLFAFFRLAYQIRIEVVKGIKENRRVASRRMLSSTSLSNTPPLRAISVFHLRDDRCCVTTRSDENNARKWIRRKSEYARENAILHVSSLPAHHQWRKLRGIRKRRLKINGIIGTNRNYVFTLIPIRSWLIRIVHEVNVIEILLLWRFK